MGERLLKTRATVAPGGFDVLGGAASPFLLVEFVRPGLITRCLVNGAASEAFLNLSAPGRWAEIGAEALVEIGIDVRAWSTWNWEGRDPGLPTDTLVTLNGETSWWRLTFTWLPSPDRSCLLAAATPITDLIARQTPAAGDEGLYANLLNEIEGLAGFGHYAYWPQERRGAWSEGISRIWTVPHPSTNREFEMMVSAIHPQDLHTSVRGEARDTVEHDSRDVRIVRADGEVRYIRTVGRREVDASGNIIRVLRLDLDVSELRRAEEELRLAREAASDAARAKDAFLHLMNHSLRTPLNAILGFGEAMRDQIYGPLSSDYVQCVDAVNDSAKRLLELVHDILDLTRLESGHYTLSKSLCNLSEMVGWCVDLMGPRVTERNLRLAACCEPEVTAWGEERGIRQIMINLLEYATQSGREQHTITLGASMGPPGEAILWLRDDGEGLLSSIEDALANPLESSANPAEPGGSSSWFGLTLVKSFLDLHNGVLRSKRQDDGTMLIEVVLPR